MKSLRVDGINFSFEMPLHDLKDLKLKKIILSLLYIYILGHN